MTLHHAMRDLGIYGTGGFGREVAWLVTGPLTEFPQFRHVAYIDDAASGHIRDTPVMRLDEFQRRFPEGVISLAVGHPQTREAIARKCDAQYATLIAQSAEMSDSVEVGAGSIICAGCILTVDIEIGKHGQINLDCTVGHDAVIGDFATLAPGVHVSGNVHIGKRAYIGTGANIINGRPGSPLIIGDDCVIGAGACVTKDCEPGCLYTGVPAVLKKRYSCE